MIFELRHFLLVDAIERFGTMTEAASHLFLTQSALSHQLRDLEEKLGSAIFDRVGRTLRLNSRGRLIQEAGNEILSRLRVLDGQLQDQSRARKVLKIKMESYTTYGWFPEVLKAFEERFPGVDVQLDSSLAHPTLQALEKGEIDVAIFSQGKPSKSLVVRPFFKDEVKIIVSKKHRYANRKSFDPAQVSSESLVVHRPLEETVFFQEVLKPLKLKPKKLTYVPLTEAAVELVKANFGIMPISEWAIQREIARGEVVPLSIEKHGLSRSWFVAYRKNADVPLLGFVDELLRHPFSY
jgi:LysR family transcriptional regulator for metE and metH